MNKFQKYFISVTASGVLLSGAPLFADYTDIPKPGSDTAYPTSAIIVVPSISTECNASSPTVTAAGIPSVSQCVTLVDPALPDAVAASLAATVNSSTQITLTWTPSASATAQQLYMSTDGVTYTASGSSLGSTINTVAVSGLTASTLYYFKVISTVASSSVSSAIVSATTSATAAAASDSGSSSSSDNTAATTSNNDNTGGTNSDGTKNVDTGAPGTDLAIDPSISQTTTTNADGSKTFDIAPITSADGSVSDSAIQVNKDGTVDNKMSVTDASGNKVEVDMKVEIAGADTKVSKDGTMTTNVPLTLDDGSKVTLNTVVAKDGTMDTGLVLGKDENGQEIKSAIAADIPGTDVKVGKDGTMTLTSPEVATESGDKATVVSTTDKSGNGSVALSLKAADGTTQTINLPVTPGSTTTFSKDAVTVDAPIPASGELTLDFSGRTLASLSSRAVTNSVKITAVTSDKPKTKIAKSLKDGSTAISGSNGISGVSINTTQLTVGTSDSVKLAKDGSYVSKTGTMRIYSGWNLLGNPVNSVIDNPASYFGYTTIFVYRGGQYVQNPASLLPGEAFWVKGTKDANVSATTTENREVTAKELMPPMTGSLLASLPKSATVQEICDAYGVKFVFTFMPSVNAWIAYSINNAYDGKKVIPAGTGFSVTTSNASGYHIAKAGWNLLSPLDNGGLSSATISQLGSKWFAYRSGQYVSNPDTIAAYEGFWLKADKNSEAKVAVTSATPPSYPQGTGWRLYGTPVAAISTDLLSANKATQMFVYVNSAYTAYDTTKRGFIPAGSGFWVK